MTTVGELTVLAHSDRDTVLSTGPDQAGGQPSSPERRAERLLSELFSTQTLIVFPAGWADNHKVKVLVSPIPIAPPGQAIVRTPQQRKWRHARNPGLYFMLVAALAGGRV